MHNHFFDDFQPIGDDLCAERRQLRWDEWWRGVSPRPQKNPKRLFFLLISSLSQ
jgi:hypothetical protein